MQVQAVTIAEIDRVLAQGFRSLFFPPAIEAKFEADTGARRSRFLLVTGAITLVVFELFLVRDRVLLGDVFAQAVIIRVGIITPFALLTFAVLWHNPRPWLRESMEAALTVLIVIALLYLCTASNSPLAAHAHYSLLLILVFPNIIQRVRFWYASTASIISVVITAIVLPHIKDVPDVVALGAVLTLTFTTILTLIANWKLEYDERLNYLLSLREELRSQKLMDVNEELSTISMLDPLTGLANRRRLEQFVQALWTMPRTARRPIAFLMLDIDYFKSFNDHYGHQAGDDCLKLVAESMQEQLRVGTDLAVRLGGEEFLAVLPDTDIHTGILVAERIRDALERRRIAHEASSVASVVTISIGVAVVWPDANKTFSEAISTADTALYSAKQHGRNRVWPPLETNGPCEDTPAQRQAS